MCLPSRLTYACRWYRFFSFIQFIFFKIQLMHMVLSINWSDWLKWMHIVSAKSISITGWINWLFDALVWQYFWYLILESPTSLKGQLRMFPLPMTSHFLGALVQVTRCISFIYAFPLLPELQTSCILKFFLHMQWQAYCPRRNTRMVSTLPIRSGKPLGKQGCVMGVSHILYDTDRWII